jgi:hypothetical protein
MDNMLIIAQKENVDPSKDAWVTINPSNATPQDILFIDAQKFSLEHKIGAGFFVDTNMRMFCIARNKDFYLHCKSNDTYNLTLGENGRTLASFSGRYADKIIQNRIAQLAK